ncbi:MAG: HNH endonuclease [Planctomycetes bacterium]|nr:HNH endonuclease [Planctomycetota bacterium]
MARSRRRLVRERARNCCEYCQLPQQCTVLPHEVDHIRAKKHRGRTSLRNMCWACAQCNGAKGSNAAGFDPLTNMLVRLFHPRNDKWNQHFRWRGCRLVGKTPVGRATIEVLGINQPDRVHQRQLLRAAGMWEAEPK